MPKGPALTKAEREEIVALRATNMSARDIAKKIDRSKTVVLNFLKSPATYGSVKRSGRKRALSAAQEQQIYEALRRGGLAADAGEEARGGDGGRGAEGGGDGGDGGGAVAKMSAERIKKEFALPLSTRRVQQLLSDWRRTARKALDQQHALPEDDTGEEGATPVRPPVVEVEEPMAAEDQVEQEAEARVAPPPPAPTLLTEDSLPADAVAEGEPQPTEEAVV